MYRLDTYDARTAIHRTLRFNSVDAAVRFMRERLNQKDMQMYIADLRNSKELDKNQFGSAHKCLYTYYGDIDLPIPSLTTVHQDMNVNGKFEYRIGTSDHMFHEGFGCFYFKLVNEYKSHTLENITQEVQIKKQDQISKQKSIWLVRPLFLS